MRRHSAKTIEKIRQGNLGKKMSKEARAKISAARLKNHVQKYCSVTGCTRRYKALGHCAYHRYQIMRADNSKTTTPNRGTHGMTFTNEYQSWYNMKSRCLNPNASKYKHYGGRGITVCDEWLQFINFYADMGDKPTPKHTIERINNDGNYEPSNCKWATYSEQNKNLRRTQDYSKLLHGKDGRFI